MEWYLMVIKKYATFTGRARRQEYWMFILFNFLIGIVLSIFDNVLGLTYDYSEYNSGGALNSLYSLFVFIPSLAVTIRRLHDVNKSGWLIGIMYIGIAVFVGMVFFMVAVSSFGLMLFLPILMMLGYGIYLFVLTVTEGTSGPNKYGEDPKIIVEPIDDTNYTSEL
jgi:uncharacterized membrane protein YhaH (DUF805 family)